MSIPGRETKVHFSETVPLFLKKTYHMIETCDPKIATWANDGLTFSIKDTEKFASQIIGQFFKHSNFSSFVRQLNFYGFRKMKADQIYLHDDVASKDWRFCHEKFQRGRPDLLSKIKKVNHAETAEKKEVDALTQEVKDLHTKLAVVSAQMNELAALANAFMGQHVEEGSPSKKRRRSVSCEETFSCLEPYPFHQQQQEFQDANISFVPEDVQSLSTSLMPLRDTSSCQTYIDTLEDEILTSLFDVDIEEDDRSIEKDDIEMVLSSETSSPQDVDSHLVNKLRDCLAMLPENMQELLVDRMESAMLDVDAFSHHGEAMMSVYAPAALVGNKRRKALEVEENTDEEAAALATSVLGAFLSRYNSVPIKKELESYQ